MPKKVLPDASERPVELPPERYEPDSAPRVLAQEYELVDIDRVAPHPENPRRGDVEAIARSVAANGFYGAIAVQKSTGRILAGNHRWDAAKAEGLPQIPVVWLDVDDKTALRILLADNRTSDLGDYDKEALASILMELRAAEELVGTGYAELDVGELLQEMGADIIKASDEDAGRDAAKNLGEMGDMEYRIILDCRDELHQTELLARFETEGLSCRALIS